MASRASDIRVSLDEGDGTALFLAIPAGAFPIRFKVA
jgi:hypothetical protein